MAETAEELARRRSRWLGLLAVAIVFAVGAVFSWRKCPEILADFGWQLYIPWRLSAGAVLYRDLFYVAGGPLSQYYNALLFRIFGVSVLTLIVSNLIIVAAMVWLIYHRFFAVSRAWMAATICTGVLLVFAFGQYASPLSAGDWNYLTPYSHEAVQGLALSLLGIALLSDWVVREKWRYLCGAGFCAGLVFLTKPDIFLALMAGVVVAFAVCGAARRQIRFPAKALAVFLPAAMTPVAGFFLYFLGRENWRESLRSVVFGWVPAFNAAVIKSPLYQWCLGLDHPAAHVRQMLSQFSTMAGVTVFYAFIFRQAAVAKPVAGEAEQRRLLRQPPAAWKRHLIWIMLLPPILILLCLHPWRGLWESPSRPTLSFGAMLAWGCVLIVWLLGLFAVALSGLKRSRGKSDWLHLLVLISPVLALAGLFNWRYCGASLPLLSVTACLVLGWNCWKPPLPRRAVFPFLWSVFGLVLLSKMGLFPRIWHYGFVLAMPAFVSAVYLLLWVLPGLLETRFAVPARLFRVTALLVLTIGLAKLSWRSGAAYLSEQLAVGAGKDKILTFGPSDNPGEAVKAAVSWVDTNTPPTATLAVLPYGVAINYLTRRINPTPCVFWDQIVMPVYGPSNMVAAFETHAPDYVLFVDRDPSNPGFHNYSREPAFRRELMPWVEAHYRLVRVIRGAPAANGPTTVKILKRRRSRRAGRGGD